TEAKGRMGRKLAAAPASPLLAVYLTASWRSWRIPENRTSGRETLHIRIARPLPALVMSWQLDRRRNLGGFRFEYEEHLELKMNQDSSEEVRERLYAAARTPESISALVGELTLKSSSAKEQSPKTRVIAP